MSSLLLFSSNSWNFREKNSDESWRSEIGQAEGQNAFYDSCRFSKKLHFPTSTQIHSTLFCKSLKRTRNLEKWSQEEKEKAGSYITTDRQTWLEALQRDCVAFKDADVIRTSHKSHRATQQGSGSSSKHVGRASVTSRCFHFVPPLDGGFDASTPQERLEHLRRRKRRQREELETLQPKTRQSLASGRSEHAAKVSNVLTSSWAVEQRGCSAATQQHDIGDKHSSSSSCSCSCSCLCTPAPISRR